MQIPVESGRKALCDYLRRGREARRMSLDDISRVTRIPHRSLEKLESGEFESLPADVFVRGFLKSYASCVGLDGDEALRRYAACGLPASPVADHDAVKKALLAEGTPAPEVLARGSVDAVDFGLGRAAVPPVTLEAQEQEEGKPDIDGDAARDFDEEVPTRERELPDGMAHPTEEAHAQQPPRPRRKRGKKKRHAQRLARAAAGTVRAAESREIALPPPASMEPAREAEGETGTEAAAEGDARRASGPTDVSAADPAPSEPGIADALPEAVPEAIGSRLVMPPRLVIDDDDPELADQARMERELREKDARDESRRTFLPEILREPDQGTRRSTLTLAVIILVIVATLAMSYLLRRSSSSGDGVTLQGELGDLDRA